MDQSGFRSGSGFFSPYLSLPLKKANQANSSFQSDFNRLKFSERNGIISTLLSSARYHFYETK
jgi:hypothetical protein